MIYTVDPFFWGNRLDNPIEHRLAPAPAVLVDFVAQYNAATGNTARPSSTEVTDDFFDDIRQAIAEMPQVVKDKLHPCLLGVFFMTGVGSSAITDVIALPNGQVLGSVVAIDIEAFLDRRANDWASWKENTPFEAAASIHLEAKIAETCDDNRKSALQYLLLHEFGHVLTAQRGFMPDWWLDKTQIQSADNYNFLSLGWTISEKITPRAEEDFPLRDQVVFYAQPRLSANDIPDIYQHLEKTSFPTLYAATNVHDDFAECFASYVHIRLLDKPYTIHVSKAGELICKSANFWKSPRSDKKRRFFEQFFSAPPQPIASAFLTSSNAINMMNAETYFLGLAPFLRMSINGGDLRQVAQEMLEKAQQDHENANLWMNLSTAFFALGQHELGLIIQSQALEMQRIYTLPAPRQKTKFRLLLLMAAGDLAENTPIDCLLEDSAIDLVLYYARPEQTLPSTLPPHDAILVAIAETTENRPILLALAPLLKDWPKPVINAPQNIAHTERRMASELLQNVPGLLMPPTREVTRATLQAITQGDTAIEALFTGCTFPIILRPLGSHAGRDLARINNSEEITNYLASVKATDFFLSRFIDYSGDDGLYRKFRIALIAGQPFACHMAISSHWMIHYVNAGMYEDAGKRAEEGAFMAHFTAFAKKHHGALEAIAQRTKLDYLCIDCAETQEGELLIFEIDHAMVVHAMDPESLFPYKKIHMQKVKNAFENFLFGLSANNLASH